MVIILANKSYDLQCNYTTVITGQDYTPLKINVQHCTVKRLPFIKFGTRGHKAIISILLISHPYFQQNRGGREVIINYLLCQ